MRTTILIFLLLVCAGLSAQRVCGSAEYISGEKLSDLRSAKAMEAAESFISRQAAMLRSQSGPGGESKIIKIPVIIHVVYNTDVQNISEAQIATQLDVLNKDFRRKNSDSLNTPERFRHLVADVKIEFYLATADPMGRPTKGIVRRKTNKTYWSSDDKVKQYTEGGDNAWDANSYLNIWVCNLKSGLGYSSAPGSDKAKDGIVINYSSFGTVNTSAPYNLGKTAVHEVGHWLGLKHIWGDTYCGDDGVDDTPPQSNFTPGCPTTFRTSCTNGLTGDMYMNYMDFTSDACINLFTNGQKDRMRSLFLVGGPRAALLYSKGLNEPWLEEAPLPELIVKEARMYPNPAVEEVTLNFETDDSWIGQTIQISNSNGILLKSIQVTSVSQKIAISSLKSGMYIIRGINGEKKFLQKLVKVN